MSQESLTTGVSIQDGTVTITITGSGGVNQAEHLLAQLETLLARGDEKIVVDISALDAPAAQAVGSVVGQFLGDSSSGMSVELRARRFEVRESLHSCALPKQSAEEACHRQSVPISTVPEQSQAVRVGSDVV